MGIFDLFKRKSIEAAPARQRQIVVKASYDAAQTNVGNQRHWSATDSLSADAAASAYVRKTLRERTRYEIANSSYAKGIQLTISNDIVGTGPRLQLLDQGNLVSKESLRFIELEYRKWSKAVGLAEKLRTVVYAEIEDGESFAKKFTNPKLKSRVKLDLSLVEADQISSPYTAKTLTVEVDGIDYDEYRNPTFYHLLKDHPGSLFNMGGFDSDMIPANQMMHLFRVDRPGQSRGIPWLTPALEQFAKLRRYSKAVIEAAETAANFAAVIQSKMPANGEAAEVDAMEVFEIEPNMITTMPEGWEMGQFKAEQPTTSYVEFVNKQLNEIARCLNIPFNIAAGNSSGYNYASGRLDHQVYFKELDIHRSRMVDVILDELFEDWLYEALLIPNYIPEDFKLMNSGTPHQWFWDGMSHVDPQKEATAQQKKLESNTTTLAAEYAKQGMDWEEQLRQRGRELELQRELGIAPLGTEAEIIVEIEDPEE